MVIDKEYINLETVIREIQDLTNAKLPKRSDPKYIGNDKIKGIEEIATFEFSSCIAFEMAIRNKEVEKIINKLNYIDYLIDKYPYLEYGNAILFESIEDNHEDDSMTLIKDLQEEYIIIANLSIATFKKRLKSLIDIKYSENYNENYYEELIKDKNYNENDIYPNKEYPEKQEFFFKLLKQYEYKDLRKKTKIDDGKLSSGKLGIVIDFLQNRLKEEFFIYPNKYYKGYSESCDEKLISKDSVSPDQFESTNEINKALIEFRKLKPTEMSVIADYFFIYDYYRHSIKKDMKRDEQSLIYKNIKYELSLYHGFKIMDKNDIEKAKSKKEIDKKDISYEACSALCHQNGDYAMNKYVDFIVGDRTIKDRIKLMSSFIDYEFYRALIYN